MRITSLTMRDLRRYKDRQVDLAPGLTIVRGPNEAGKSTIQRAIELALTRKVTSAAGDLEASGDDVAEREAQEQRDVLRLGRLLLSGQEVTL